jgi:hypothetical protein
METLHMAGERRDGWKKQSDGRRERRGEKSEGLVSGASFHFDKNPILLAPP